MLIRRRCWSLAKLCRRYISWPAPSRLSPFNLRPASYASRYRGYRSDSSKMDSTLENIKKQEPQPNFRFSDYDCVGFDLDNTILKYNISNLVKLEYEALARFLVEKKGYNASYLLKPIDVDFLQKGLALDYENGNVLQLGPGGIINRASHGTKLLNNSALEELYGKDRLCPLTQEYTQNMLNTWNGPISERIRSVMDYFDMPAALAFARCVDCIDAESNAEKKPRKYNLYHHITQGLINLYQRDNFSKNSGGFFPEVKKNPEKYLHRCSATVCKWLKELKNSKKVFLVTGSNVDFASFTAQYCLGDHWQSLFDIVVCFARKPGFFTGRRPFVSVENGHEKDIVEPENLHFGNIYSQGNWQDLYELFKRETKSRHPKCVYVGDNILQDVFAPDEYTRCDAIAISEEMRAEGVGDDKSYANVLASNTWGSYFSQREGKNSLWCDLIQRHSVICVPSVDILAQNPLDFKIQSFKNSSPDEKQTLGFFPKAPIS